MWPRGPILTLVDSIVRMWTVRRKDISAFHSRLDGRVIFRLEPIYSKARELRKGLNPEFRAATGFGTGPPTFEIMRRRSMVESDSASPYKVFCVNILSGTPG